MKRKIGIYSGSFDPVHDGHISFAKQAAKECGLETIVFMPERFPRGKPNVSPISERIAELEIALAKASFIVLNASVEQFTVDETLPELEALYPDTDFTFLVGSDVALNLPNWKNVNRLATKYDFAVGMRAGDAPEAIEQAMHAIQARWTLVTTSYGHVSSKQLRLAG